MSSQLEDEGVAKIKGMGLEFDEDQIRNALQSCHNNPEEAMQLLMPESPQDADHLGYHLVSTQTSESSYERDVDMRDTETHPGSGGESDRDSTTVSYSLEEDRRLEEGDEEEGEDSHSLQFQDSREEEELPPRPEGPPPRYEDIVVTGNRIVEDPQQEMVTPVVTPVATPRGNRSSSIEFPLTHFYELESRVHTDQWSIPYKREESLAICMMATTNMIREGAGLADADENCRKFLDRTMIDCFTKLLTHEAVFRWDASIMEGILDMSQLLMELIAERLKQPPIPLILLHLLAMVWNADNNYHTKMKAKRADNTHWERVFGKSGPFAQMPPFQMQKSNKGLLVDILNTFAQHGGVQAVTEAVLKTENITLKELKALFYPFSQCEDYLCVSYLKAHLSKPMVVAIKFVGDLSDSDFKDKEVDCVSDLLKSLKALMVRCSLWDKVSVIDQLRLDTTHRMLNIPHFNAKMNALKEVVRLTDEPFSSARGVKSPLTEEKVRDWLVSKKILSIALQGNLHHTQYCDKLRSILEFLGVRLTLDELTSIWEMQVNENPVQVENVHSILAAAASRFTPQHLDHLFTLVSQSWESASDRYREKLLELIGKIGKDDRSGKTASKILDLLWNLAHLPHISREMVELALEAHSSILIESYSMKESERKSYIGKCVEDIRKGVWVVPGFKQLHRFAKGFYKTNYGQKDQHQIAELQRQYDLLRQTCASLNRCHTKAVKDCETKGDSLTGETLVDGKYSHRECVDIHLKFMAFLLQDGALYIPTKRAVDIWDTLIANPNACDMDRKLAFKWFDIGMGDMELETQITLFQSRVLKVDPSKLDQAGYQCLRNFFETINLAERKLKKVSSTYHSLIVETPDLTGIDYLWRAALEVRDIKIADELISNILQISYQGLSTRLKKDVGALHQRFFDECFKRLDNLELNLEKEEPVVVPTTGKGVGTLSELNLKLQSVERLLLLLERYIMVAEENYHFMRHYPPHGASFLGHPISLTISPDQNKAEFKLECHSNESILSVRRRVAQKMGCSQEQIQMGISERWLEATDNNRLIHQLKFKEHQNIIVKTVLYARGNETAEGVSQRQSMAHEQERSLPGVILSRQKELFDRLESLCEMGSSAIISRARSLLMLIPTDPRPVENMEIFTHQTHQGAGDDPQSPASPHTILRDYFDTTKTTPTKLLYCLEILSSRLIPAGDQEVDEGQVQLFRRNFLECGGLKSVINVLQRNALPSDVDLSVRQDCYAISLALARFLLCNQATLPPAQKIPYRQLSIPASTTATSSSSASSSSASQPGDGTTAATAGRRDTGSSVDSNEPMVAEATGGERPKMSKVVSSEDEVARLTIETMGVDDFATMLAYLVRVCWSAAAGQLHLASISDSTPPSPSIHHRSNRETTPTSSSSMERSGTEGEEGGAKKSTQLRAGLCLQQETDSVSSKNAAIAREALELLVTCLKLRPNLLNILYTLSHIEDFIIDILLGSPHLQIRLSVVEQLILLCSVNTVPSSSSLSSDSMPVKRAKTSQVESPKHFFIHLLLKRPQSLWDTTLDLRRPSQVVEWERCAEYFEFRAQLLQNLYVLDIDSLSIDVLAMLKEELHWLSNSSPPSTSSFSSPSSHSTSVSAAWQSLLAGHLRLTLALFTCSNIDKKKHGYELAQKLVETFLFPASKMILDSVEPTGIVSVIPHCTEPHSRIAAYMLLIELCRGCHDNLVTVARQLIKLHHHDNPQFAKEWEFQPPVVGRSPCGYVGLKNAGATCYMNSVLQQLYMTKPAREVILSAAPESETEQESILPEVQSVFGHLLESKLQFYAPENFWKTFKLWGQPVNVREQQDAYDFFCNLTDQVDEQLKKLSLPKVFDEVFGGAYLDQKICRDCEHTYDREESFLSVSLPVKSRSLQESLKEHVKGEMLEGENAYLCEKCQEKRDTLKRMCFKKLPPVMVVHLKRFDYDWEANRAIKFDDYFEFPWMLDMEPYTAHGIEAREKAEGPQPAQMYDLVGIVVHSGQASAGHYYSFIKEKSYLSSQLNPNVIPEEKEGEEEEDSILPQSLNPPTSGGGGRWLRFNDTKVEQFLMSNAALEAECFGGSYKAKPTDSHSTTPEMRVRYWNAYLLFYEAVNHGKQPSIPRKLSADSPNPSSPAPPPHGGEDKLRQLQALVQKGERRHLFDDTMPAGIQHKVNEDNLQFMRHRDVYCTEYYDFLRELFHVNHVIYLDHSHLDQGQYGVISIQLATNFLLHTYFRTKKNLRADQEVWVSHMQLLLRECQEACQWFMEKMAADGGKYLKPYLLECTSKEVRHCFSEILSTGVQSYLSREGRGGGEEIERGPVGAVINIVLVMLEKDVVDNCKSCCEYFAFLKNYASYPQGVHHLLEKDAFVSILNFLLGPPPKDQENRPQDKDKYPPRRWTSNQVKEFGPLHGTLSLLVRNTDISVFETESPDEKSNVAVDNPYCVTGNHVDLRPPPDSMHQALFSIEHSKRFIHECVLTLRECDPTATDAIAATFCYCCWNNQSFSACTIEDLQVQISNVPANEIKSYFKVLTELLLIEDLLQAKRISFAIQGSKYQPHVAIFNTIQSNTTVQADSKKAYHGIKFLVGLGNKSKACRDFLVNRASDWQWAVAWLRRKMSDYHTWPSSTISNESSNTRAFTRSDSAQDTLEEASALLKEIEARDSRQAAAAAAAGHSSSVDNKHSSENSSELSSNTQQHSNIDRLEG